MKDPVEPQFQRQASTLEHLTNGKERLPKIFPRFRQKNRTSSPKPANSLKSKEIGFARLPLLTSYN